MYMRGQEASKCLNALAARAMQQLDVTSAIQIYREIGDAGMVLALERLASVQDRALLAGHISLLFNDFNKAQDYFLSSSYPEAALEMRRDLLQWESALKLAKHIDPSQLPIIGLEYAKQAEHMMEYGVALENYDNACEELKAMLRDQAGHAEASDPAAAEGVQARIVSCTAGIARCSLLTGDLRRGVAIAKESQNTTLCAECGEILENMNQKQDAANLYELAREYEKAAQIYIASQKFTQAAQVCLVSLVGSGSHAS